MPLASSQTGYDFNNLITQQWDTDDDTGVIFDSTDDKTYPAAPAMRFQVGPGYTTSCWIHIDGFHVKGDPTDTLTWEKSIVVPNIPLDIVFRNPTNPSMGYITKVYAWSEDGATPLLWTPLVRY